MKPLLFAAFVFIQTEIPFKNTDEFVLKVNLKFKQRPVVDRESYSSSGDRLNKTNIEAAPFLEVDITELKILEDEVRILAVDGKETNLLKKKTTPAPKLHFEFGFVEDVKNGKANNEINIYFLSAEKK